MTRWLLAAVAALTLGALAAPLQAGAQQTTKVYRVGYLYGIPIPPSAPVFEQGLRELGWIKGQNIAIEYRSAEGHLGRLPGLAAELVALGMDVIVANAAPETSAARQATRSIPIVFVFKYPFRRPGEKRLVVRVKVDRIGGYGSKMQPWT